MLAVARSISTFMSPDSCSLVIRTIPLNRRILEPPRSYPASWPFQVAGRSRQGDDIL